MASSSSSKLLISTKSQQKGIFVVAFDKKESGDHFTKHFDDAVHYFSAGGVISLVASENFSYVKGIYTAVAGIDVLKALQFAVNKTFDKGLNALDHGAFSSGRTDGSVTIAARISDSEEDIPKRAASTAVSKSLIINASGLDRDLNVLFAFADPNNDQLYHTQFPTAWKVAYFSKGSNNVFSATYVAQYAVGAIQLVNGNTVTPTVWTDAAPGDNWSLTYTNNTYHLALTKPGDPTQTNVPITALNSTGGPNPIAIGFDNNGSFNIALTQNSVGNSQTARFLFTPVLNAWVVSDIVQNQVLASEILSPALFGTTGINLLSLGPVTNFAFVQNPDGSYSISQSS